VLDSMRVKCQVLSKSFSSCHILVSLFCAMF
jgi:hypothetical protein